MADEFTLTARWVFPVSAPPLERGLVTVRNGRIIAVEPYGTRKADIDLGDMAIVPGFVNAHTHLDLSGARGNTPPTQDFVGWLRRVIAYRRGRTSQQIAADVQAAIAESIRFGTTLIGDIAAEGDTWDALRMAPLRAIVFRELLGLSIERTEAAWEGLKWWLAAVEATPTCRPGVSPHAPYSVSDELFIRATATRLPLAIHLAETQAELDLLADRRGPLVPFLKELGVWAPDRLLAEYDRLLMLSRNASSYQFVHCNYLTPRNLIPPKGSIVYCPRTHAAFGHPPHPFREFLSRGVRVALGTDSLASNPDLSILAETRFLRFRNPDFPADTLLRLATLNGAVSLGWADETGSLDPGKSADFAVIALPNRDAADPHELVFDSDLPVVATWFRGQKIYDAKRL